MSDETASPRGRLREHVAEEIRVLLARRRMSATQLARRTGIKQSTLSRRMTGETAFDMDDLEVIAEVLEVEVSDLLPRGVAAGQGPRRDVTSAYHKVAARRTERINVRRDNRPRGYPVEVATPAPGRTSYVSRNAHRRRDR